MHYSTVGRKVGPNLVFMRVTSDHPFLTKPRWSIRIAREWPNGHAVLRSWRNAIGINYAGRSLWLIRS